MMADASASPLIAGPAKATAWGNLFVQARAIHGGSDTKWRRFLPAWRKHRHEPKASQELAGAVARS